MNEFLRRMFEEMGARRRRLRQAFGDRGQGIVELLTLGGLLLGSVGLLIAPWMSRAAPWGFALPFVFIIGYVLLERRRQAQQDDVSPQAAAKQERLDEAELAKLIAQTKVDDPDFGAADHARISEKFRAGAEARWRQRMVAGADWATFLWAFACSLAGAAAFVIGWSAKPAPPEPPAWEPPAHTIDSQIETPP